MKIWNKDLCGQSHIETTPVGKRLSDGIIWASEASGFYQVSSSDIVWSRSMIEEFGGCLDDDKLVNPEPSPCRIIPWFSRQYHSYDVLKGAMIRDEITADDPAPLLIVEPQTSCGPLLQECVTTRHLPEVLLINDPLGHTGAGIDMARYVRAIPPISRKELVPIAKTGLLCASPIARVNFTTHLGNGNHSSVHRALLQLLWVDSGITVAVKIASSDSGASRMLLHEAKIYASLPDHLMDDWSGFHYMEEAQENGDGIVPVHAVVPKFYGCYVPMTKDKHRSQTQELMPLLLIEDCGQPVVPESLTREQREECCSLVARFHRAGYVQNSLFARNIVMQPGPLTQPPWLRTMNSASFRLIDFGRTERYNEHRARKARAGVDQGEIDKLWQRNTSNELRVAKELFTVV